VIFVTVGTQLTFDRMVDAVDVWAAQNDEEVVAQVGRSNHSFTHIKQHRFLEPIEFDRYFLEARLVVAHAGMGSIIGALSNAKPLIIMPRNATLGEHRNDHQMATARRFLNFAGVQVAWNECELSLLLNKNKMAAGRLNAEILPKNAPEYFLRNLKFLIE